MKLTLIRLFVKLLSIPSLRINQAIGGLLGYSLYWFPNRLKKVSAINLQLCFPDKTPDERQALLKRSLIEIGKTFTEIGPLWYWPESTICSLVNNTQAWQQVDEALAAGNGVILLTPHIGSWEVSGIYASQRYGTRANYLYRPPRLKALEPLLVKTRSRQGANLFPTNNQGLRQLFRAIKNGDVVGLLPDQEPGKGSGTFTPFMGTPAYTVNLVHRLAFKNRTPVFMFYFERLPKGQGYFCHANRLSDDIHSNDLEQSNTIMNQAIEKMIAINPGQYMWSYKRFNRTPNGKKNRYK